MATKSYRKDFHGKNPYYDDFDPSKKFVRIMSRPGFPLQAREITQLQTIAQTQIERISDHFFEEGASVKGGDITEGSGHAIRLANTSYTDEELKSFIGKLIINRDTGVEARILSYADASPNLNEDQYQILFVAFTTSGSFQPGAKLIIKGTLPEIEVSLIENVKNPPAVDIATNIIGINTGIYYADGFLVESDAETLAVQGITNSPGPADNQDLPGQFTGPAYRTFASPSASIGFTIKRDLVSSEEDDTLKDPSFGFYNFNSPGADRYKISLELSQKTITSTGVTFDSEDYFEVMRVINGETTKQVRYTDYALFEDTLARRTFDESGNYTVRPFPLKPETYLAAFGGSSPKQHAIKLDSGKAYIGGYEFETIAPRFLPVDRALTIGRVQQAILQTPLTNYVNVTDAFDAQKGSPRESYTKHKKAFVQRVSGSTTEILGTCNIRTIEEDVAGNVKLYLFNINMNETGTNKGFARSTHIAVDDGTSTDNTQRYRIGTTDTDTALENVGPARQIFKAPLGSGLVRASSNDGLISSFLVKKAYTFEITSGDSVEITSGKPFLDGTQSNYVCWYDDNSSGNGAIIRELDGSSQGMSILVNNLDTTPKLTITKGSGLGAGEGTLIASQRWTNTDASDVESNIRRKTLVDGSCGAKTGDPTTGIITLNHCDVFQITTISDGTRDVTNSFDLDTNAGIDAYRRSRLVLKAGATCGTDANGNIQIDSAEYKYFDHSGDGPFTVDSYPLEQINYEQIPDFTDPETGESYNLADAFDFRPVATDDSETSFDNGSGGSQVVAFQNDVIASTVSYEHYLSRIDSVVLDRQTRDFKIVKGTPAITPKAPEVDALDMNLGNLIIPPYTKDSRSIKYRYIDNQRSTMMDINDIESSVQFDAYFAFKNDLEQEALNRAQNFRSSRTAFSDGIFVDTFIGHNNAVTAKRDHNASVDPEFGELRPAFETTFIRMGMTGAALGSDAVQTSDNIFLPTSQAVVYEENNLASGKISANQFAVADYLGTMTLSPSSDNFFTGARKPLVIVNTVGEVDNWETSISAFQRGRVSGFGSQWRDWETLWFGSRKRNDVNLEHDSSGSEYTNPRRSSYVSRIISDKLIKKIGNKIVDLSVVPFINSRRIEFRVDNMKPNSPVYVHFDGERYNAPDGSAHSRTDSTGSMTGSIQVSNTHTTGKKLLRVTDTTNGSLELATHSADATYYAEGLLDCKEGDSYSVRPVITRRKASNADDVSTDYYEANAANNLSRTYNSVTPFAQELFIDPTNYPNGMLLKDVELFFCTVPEAGQSQKSPPVKVHIRPMYNGSPHPFKVLPFSEVTLSDISEANFDSKPGEGTKFEFSTPVYLKPNTSYAICISTNAPYALYYGEEGEVAQIGPPITPSQGSNTVTKPLYFGPMHLPLNNGTSTAYDNRFLKMVVSRCAFNEINEDTSFAVFETNTNISLPYHVGFVHSNEQPNDSMKPVYQLESFNYGNAGNETLSDVQINTTLDDFALKKIIGPSQPTKITTRFKTDETKAVASMIDGDRIGYLAVEYMANNDDAAAVLEEKEPTARLATNRSRYVGRKVTLNRTADDIVVIVDGSYVDNSQIKVYVKLQGPDQPNSVFDDNDYEELFPEGNSTLPTSAKFAELKPQGEVGGVMRFTTDSLLPGTASEFTAYQVKILLMGENVNNDGNAKQIPVINTVSAVPLRRVSQDEIRRYIPPGTILNWGGSLNGDSDAPFGFVYCDGASYNYVTNPEYKVLFEAIGYSYGGAGNSFNVPDMRGRSVKGTAAGSHSYSYTCEDPTGAKPPTLHTVNLTAGGIGGDAEHIRIGHRHLPPHTHRVGGVPGDEQRYMEDSGGFGIMSSKLGFVQEAGKDGNPSYSFQQAGLPSNLGIFNPYAGGLPSTFGSFSDGMRTEPIAVTPRYIGMDYIIKI